MWAMTQTNLGAALLKLGEREAGTARREEAVQAYRDALGEWTRERVPLDWAYTQHGLAGALAVLAGREKDAIHAMEEAVVRMRGAVQAYQQVGESYWLPEAQRRTVAAIIAAAGVSFKGV
jgi:dTDP-4-amino-4,6-dideoxygalactose transaminase